MVDQVGDRALLRTRQNALAFPSQELKNIRRESFEECEGKGECSIKLAKHLQASKHLLRTRQNALAFPSQELKNELKNVQRQNLEECESKEECNIKLAKHTQASMPVMPWMRKLEAAILSGSGKHKMNESGSSKKNIGSGSDKNLPLPLLWYLRQDFFIFMKIFSS